MHLSLAAFALFWKHPILSFLTARLLEARTWTKENLIQKKRIVCLISSFLGAGLVGKAARDLSEERFLPCPGLNVYLFFFFYAKLFALRAGFWHFIDHVGQNLRIFLDESVY